MSCSVKSHPEYTSLVATVSPVKLAWKEGDTDMWMGKGQGEAIQNAASSGETWGQELRAAANHVLRSRGTLWEELGFLVDSERWGLGQKDKDVVITWGYTID